MLRNIYILAIALLLGVPAYAAPKLEVSVVVDRATANQYVGNDLRAAIDDAFFVAGDIYQRELDISLTITIVEVADDIPGHTKAEALIDAMYAWRQKHPEHLKADATVLFTSRDIINYVGYAHGIATVCTGSAVAVGELHQDFLAGYTLAHELGHILGAPHDGVDECKNEPTSGYVMEALIYPYATFSNCSKEVIKRRVENLGSCMIDKPAPPPPVQGPTAGMESGKGGGGSMDLLFLAALALLVVGARFRVYNPLNVK